MPIFEDLKEYAERATGLQRPRQGGGLRFRAGEKTPRRSPQGRRSRPQPSAVAAHHLPGAVELDDRHDPAAVIEDLFEANGWGDTWRDGIYD